MKRTFWLRLNWELNSIINNRLSNSQAKHVLRAQGEVVYGEVDGMEFGVRTVKSVLITPLPKIQNFGFKPSHK